MASEQRRAQRRRRQARNKAFLESHRARPCVDCGIQYDPRSMSLVWKEKEPGAESISKMILYSQDRLLTEVAKCDVLCANCGNYRSWKAEPMRTGDALSIRGRLYIKGLKTNKPCHDCSQIFHYSSMEFDHRPGEVKRRNISKMDRYSIANIDAEVAKCDLVCANCHRIRTYERLYGK